MNTPLREEDVIYDWNVRGHTVTPPMRTTSLHDETLRDGVQSPSVKDPDDEHKLRIMRLLDDLGVQSMSVGLPGAGARQYKTGELLVTAMRDEGRTIRPATAARTLAADIEPVVELSNRLGVPIEVMAFLGSSPIRMITEKWEEDRLEKLTRDAMAICRKGGVPASFVTEDTIRSRPSTLRRLFTAAIEEGATRLVLCDTVGHATPNGVMNLVHWTVALLEGLGVRDRVQIDWHGHNDRGHALPNALVAIEAGCDQVHGTILGVGERVGNTSLDQLLVNLKLLGLHQGDLHKLDELVHLVSDATDVEIPVNYPVFGRDAFRTATGVHAAAVVKAKKQGLTWLEDKVYSGVPASWFGLDQKIEIGHMSGTSNITCWCLERSIEPTEPVVKAIWDAAKRSNRVLEEEELMEVVRGASA